MTEPIRIVPATVERFDDVALMVGPKNPESNVCWCLSHRIPAKQNRELGGTDRRDCMRELCGRSVAPGVLAYRDDEVVGWAAVAPRSELPVHRSTRIRPVDELAVWSIICVRVRPGHRKTGVSHALVLGAVDYARSQGAPGVEAYPVDNNGAKVDTTMAFVGILSVFEAAGFEKVADTDAVAGGFPRVIVRYVMS